MNPFSNTLYGIAFINSAKCTFYLSLIIMYKIREIGVRHHTAAVPVFIGICAASNYLT